MRKICAASDTWLFVIYQTEDGGAVVGWVNALYLQVFDECRRNAAFWPACQW